jgi:GxxExxY protein
MELNQISEKIIGAAYTVSNKLGCGFLEKVYENALAIELKKQGLKVTQQPGLQVKYDGIVVGEYVPDLLIEDLVIVELKTARALEEIHAAQCLNYLKATHLKLCLLINFAKPKIDVKRFSN